MSIKSCVNCLPWLRKLAKARGLAKRYSILKKAPKGLLNVLHEIIRNILNGRINLNKRYKTKLQRYKNELRTFSSKSKLSIPQQKRFLIQKGGFLPSLLVPVISMLASVAVEKLIK